MNRAKIQFYQHTFCHTKKKKKLFFNCNATISLFYFILPKKGRQTEHVERQIGLHFSLFQTVNYSFIFVATLDSFN